MFKVYELVIEDSNVVTDKGIEFIFKCLFSDNTEHIGNVCTGTNTKEASATDTAEDFSLLWYLDDDVNIEIENNVLTYNIKTDGKKLDNTTEIGIMSDNKDSPTLITRDKHDRYNIPQGSLINLKYKLTLYNL